MRANFGSKFNDRKPLESAILLFAKLPVPGNVKSRLGASIGPSAAARLAAAMLTDRLEQLGEGFSDADPERVLLGDQELGELFSPYFQLLEKSGFSANCMESRRSAQSWGGWKYRSQGPGSLGQRIYRAITSSFNRGRLVVGSDAVSQEIGAVQHALECLKKGIPVIQPAEDGGFTLLGLPRGMPPRGHASTGHSEAWDPLAKALAGERLPWKPLASALQTMGWAPEILGEQLDIDELSDVESLLLRLTPEGGEAQSWPRFLQELSKLPKDVWSVPVEMPILRARGTAPTATPEKE